MAKAREKAAEKRRLLGETTRREQALKDAAFQDRLKAIEAAEREQAAKQVPIKAVKKKVKAVPVAPPTDEDSSSSSEDEAPAPAPKAVDKYKEKYKALKARAAQPPPKPDRPDEAVREVARDRLREKLDRAAAASAYASIFPGANNPYS